MVSMRHLSWIAVAVAVVLVVALAYPLLQTTRQLRTVQSELGRANEQVVQSEKAATERERANANLQKELDAASKARTEVQENLDEATSDNEQLRKELEKASAQIEQLTNAAQSKLNETQSQLKNVEAELESAKRVADQEKSGRAELEQRAAGLNAELKKADGQRIELQEKLDKANSEIERLRSELQNPSQSEEGNSKSQQPDGTEVGE
jgi:septal ring factor EnvC (AmiA/AmiB activator)